MIRSALLVLGLYAAAHAEVYVLDASGAGDFATLQEVNAGTVDGDIVLVRPGNYPASTSSSVEFGGKGLTIMADGTGPVSFPAIRIFNVFEGQTFVLRGVRLENDLPVGLAYSRLEVDGVFGNVVVEDCSIAGIASPSVFTPNFAVNAVASNLSLESCEIIGSKGGDKFSALSKALPGNWGLRVLGSHVSVSDCTIVGGDGGDEPLGWEEEGAGAGGPAIVCVLSTLLLSGCTVVGGAGGHDTGDPQIGGAPAGGAGLIADGASLIRLRDTTIVGGVGGTDASGVDGPPGPAIDSAGATLITLPGPARTLHIDAPLDELGAGQLVADGAPGELALLLVSTASAWVDVPKFGGALLVGAPVGQLLPMGQLDASGHVQTSVVIPDVGLPPGSAVQVLLQLVTTSGSSTVLGDASALVLLGT